MPRCVRQLHQQQAPPKGRKSEEKQRILSPPSLVARLGRRARRREDKRRRERRVEQRPRPELAAPIEHLGVKGGTSATLKDGLWRATEATASVQDVQAGCAGAA